MIDAKRIAEEIYSRLDDMEYTKDDVLNALEKPSGILLSMDDFLSFFFFDFVPKEKIEEIKSSFIALFEEKETVTFKDIRIITFKATE